MSDVLSHATDTLVKRQRKRLNGGREQSPVPPANAVATGTPEDVDGFGGVMARWVACGQQESNVSSPPLLRPTTVLRSPGSPRLDHSGSSRELRPSLAPNGSQLEVATSIDEALTALIDAAGQIIPTTTASGGGGVIVQRIHNKRSQPQPGARAQRAPTPLQGLRFDGDDFPALPGSPMASERQMGRFDPRRKQP